jgi:hypothetical protein
MALISAPEYISVLFDRVTASTSLLSGSFLGQPAMIRIGRRYEKYIRDHSETLHRIMVNKKIYRRCTVSTTVLAGDINKYGRIRCSQTL